MKRFLFFAQKVLYRAYPTVFAMAFIVIIMYDWTCLRELGSLYSAALFFGVAIAALLPMSLAPKVSKLAERLLKTQYGASYTKPSPLTMTLIVVLTLLLGTIVLDVEDKCKRLTQRQYASLVLVGVVSAGILTWWLLSTFVVVYWILCGITVILYLTCLVLMVGTAYCALLRVVSPVAGAPGLYAYDMETGEKIEVEFVQTTPHK